MASSARLFFLSVPGPEHHPRHCLAPNLPLQPAYFPPLRDVNPLKLLFLLFNVSSKTNQPLINHSGHLIAVSIHHQHMTVTRHSDRRQLQDPGIYRFILQLLKVRLTSVKVALPHDTFIANEIPPNG